MAYAGRYDGKSCPGCNMNGLVSVLLSSFLGACFGAIAGSFLTVVVHRLPRVMDTGDERIPLASYVSGLAWPSSHCPHCCHRVIFRDLIPILSFAALRGRCRFCG